MGTIRCPARTATMTKPAEIARAFACPLIDTVILAAFGLFYLAIELILRAVSGAPHFIVFGLILAAFVLPALCLYLMELLEALANGGKPKPLAVEHLHWYGSAWSLVQLLYLGVLVYAVHELGAWFGGAALLAAMLLLAAVLPASLTILALTRSPLESLKPRAIGRLIGRCGAAYWIVPSFFLIAILTVNWLGRTRLHDGLVDLVSLYLVFAFYTLTGSIVKPHELHREVDIYDPLEPDEQQADAALTRQRTAVLGHAYGFISRGNRAGGLKHIHDWLDEDPQPDTAWPWFFEAMLRWETKEPALAFGQPFLSRLLQRHDAVGAVKLMMRCRLENAAFMPFPEDRLAAREAAEQCQSEELMRTL